MTLEESSLYWLLYRGLRLKCGLYRRYRMKRSFQQWHAAHPQPPSGHKCWLCHQAITSQADFSLDHVIALDLAYTYGLSPWLVFDSRNLQPCHRRCNSDRGNRMPTYAELQRIPHVSSSLLIEFQALRRAMRPGAHEPRLDRYLERAGVGQT